MGDLSYWTGLHYSFMKLSDSPIILDRGIECRTFIRCSEPIEFAFMYRKFFELVQMDFTTHIGVTSDLYPIRFRTSFDTYDLAAEPSCHVDLINEPAINQHDRFVDGHDPTFDVQYPDVLMEVSAHHIGAKI